MTITRKDLERAGRELGRSMDETLTLVLGAREDKPPEIPRRAASPSKAVPCSRCGAAIGQACRSPANRPTRAHGERLRALKGTP